MRICVFSDIHGNADALKALLSREKETADCFLFLGDIFGYFYDQQEIINILRNTQKLYSIMGNHDNAYLMSLEDEELKKKMLEKYGSSYEIKLGENDIEYLKKMPLSLDLNIDNKKITAFHGGPEDFLNQRIYPDTTQDLIKIKDACDYLFVGHTHYQYVIKKENTLIINPGSLGQPRDGKGFSYCILDTGRNEVTFKTVQVDIEKLLLQVKEKDYMTNNYNYLIKKYEVIK